MISLKFASSPNFARVAAFLALLAISACGDAQKQGGAPPPATVTVSHPVKRFIVDYDEYVGRFVAVGSVEIRARVSGYLDKVHFKDGQMVKTGDLLFTIDKRPFQNTLAQVEANLAQAKANLAFTEADLARAQQLLRDKTIAEQNYEQRLQAKRTAEASVAANEALVRQAELDLEFTELRAPIDGRIGDRRVTPGNVVAGGSIPSTTLLATIVSIDPVYFEFTFDEASFLRYERLSNRGEEVANRNDSTKVRLKLIDEDKFAHEGRMDFVDNVIDRTTGTIRGRARFANSNGLFTPGMFARVQVLASALYEAVMVPDAVIGTEQSRKFVLAVGNDGTVAQKYVTLGQLVGDLRVIKTGLTDEDRVIVNGMQRARVGQKVNAQEQGTAPAAAPPATSSAQSK